LTSIADTLQLKLVPMFVEFPAKIIGLYGELFGFSKDVVIRFAASLAREYDNFTDAQKKLVHRVTNYFMNPASPLRSQIDCLTKMRQSIISFPRLRREVQEYAFALLVAHKLEGMHRTLKCFTSRGTVVRPALACSRVRGVEVSRFCDNPHYVKFANQQWDTKESKCCLNSLLHPRFAMSQLFRMTLAQKASHLYQYHDESQFADSTEATNVIAAFSSYKSNECEVQSETRSAADSALVSFYKAGFEEGAIYSVDSRMFRSVSDVHHSVPVADISAVFVEALAAADLPRIEYDTTFFEVISCHPEAKTTIRTTHVQKKLTHVRCQLLQVVEADDGTFTLEPRPDLPFELDLMNWSCAEMFRLVSLNLQRWTLANHLLQPTPIRNNAVEFESAPMDAAMEGTLGFATDAVPLLSLVDDSPAELALAIAPAGRAEHSLVPFVGDVDPHSCLKYFWERGSNSLESMEKWCGVRDLPDMDSVSFRKLVADGVLLQEETDDLRFVFALNVDKIKLTIRHVVTRPSLFVSHVARSEADLKVSKLGMMCMQG
jgi:hypothetical protein